MAQVTTTQKSSPRTYGKSRLDSWHWISPVGIFIITTLGIIIAYQLIAPPGLVAQINQNQIEDMIRDQNIPWQLEADEINYDQNLDEYSASGNVLIFKGNIKLLADEVRFDHKNLKAYAYGNVVLTNGEDILSGTSMEIDLENQIGSVENGYLFLKENNFHLTGNLIKKVGAKTYTIDEASLTTCDGDNPDWRVTGKKFKFKDDGPEERRVVIGAPATGNPAFWKQKARLALSPGWIVKIRGV